MFDKQIFAEKIRDIRLTMKMSQKDFAAMIEVRQTSLSDYETGKRIPRIDIVSRIAEKCNRPIDWFCETENSHFHYTAERFKKIYENKDIQATIQMYSSNKYSPEFLDKMLSMQIRSIIQEVDSNDVCNSGNSKTA